MVFARCVTVCQLSARRMGRTARVAMAQASSMVQCVGQACKAKARLGGVLITFHATGAGI